MFSLEASPSLPGGRRVSMSFSPLLGSGQMRPPTSARLQDSRTLPASSASQQNRTSFLKKPRGDQVLAHLGASELNHSLAVVFDDARELLSRLPEAPVVVDAELPVASVIWVGPPNRMVKGLALRAEGGRPVCVRGEGEPKEPVPSEVECGQILWRIARSALLRHVACPTD
jgi:hypothetical protein